jgi:hypothetical protein
MADYIDIKCPECDKVIFSEFREDLKDKIEITVTPCEDCYGKCSDCDESYSYQDLKVEYDDGYDQGYSEGYDAAQRELENG